MSHMSNLDIEMKNNERERSIYVTLGTREEDGGCNFCTNRTDPKVWILKSTNPDRRLGVLICPRCFSDLFDLIKMENKI